MAEYITTADYPAIRAAIDVTLDNRPSDATITASAVADDAERELENLGYDHSEYGAADQALVKRAAVLTAAALLAPSLRSVLSQTITRNGVSYTIDRFDAEARAADLRARAADILDDVTPNATASDSAAESRPTLMVVASSRRGR